MQQFKYLAPLTSAALLLALTLLRRYAIHQESPTTPSELSTSFYANTCPNFPQIARSVIRFEVANDSRSSASILKLHFRDCFAQGCDGSLLPQVGKERGDGRSTKGLKIINNIKRAVETSCPETVSCADILALSARESVIAVSEVSIDLSYKCFLLFRNLQLGGPSWTVEFGRRDNPSSASVAAAVDAIPSPNLTATQLIESFQKRGLSKRDLVALSGGHSIGQAQCSTFSARLFNGTAGDSIDPALKSRLEKTCPPTALNRLNNLDPSPTTFDNLYFRAVQANQSLLFSDQQLLQSDLAGFVKEFANNQKAFFTAFANAMIKIGKLSPLTGGHGEIRASC
ncbi:peroxidase P7 isoform X1 [Selaginella moellendorffii]|uniref:peroxidase P7 isoform X1 n=1 Tax=Selaginella moellendorffii TaxID=88036 RepID=UPI000D1CB952|nr:peroxidase P7 isoform X1 [Selaginella moellendorffii]|eukprot:XP_024532762.1 peroxidase P7 isoform X1 [Selaginella moellendorffii]